MLHRGTRFHLAGITAVLIVLSPLASAAHAGAAPGSATAGSARAAVQGVVAQRGDRNNTVRAIQQALLNAGITVPGGADGVFGSGTQTAVTAYQQRRGLTASGVVDTATAVALGVVPATPLLARGANGPAVVAVQQQLIAVGLTPRGGADGWYGSGTEASMRQFQTAKALPSTGQLDAATAQILANAAASATPSPAPAPAPAPTPSLPAPGSSGAAVKAFQEELTLVGFRPKGGADGVYGPATVTALGLFQKSVGLPANGRYDQATATALTIAANTARSGGGSGGGGSGGGGTGGGPSGTNPDGTVTLANFPMPKRCTFWDTWGAPRSGGRTHQGVDIMAPSGTPLYAVQGGTITKTQTSYPGSLAGNAIWLTAADGTYFFYAHLSGFVSGVGKGTVVKAGDLIGYVGSTGNASIPHLHFEVHPRGGAAVNPYPIVRPVSGC